MRHGVFAAHEIIIVDDGSVDRTPLFLDQVLKGSPVKVLGGQPNRGKGAALQAGVMAAESDYILCTDADLSTPIDEVEKLLPRLDRGGFDVAIGSRRAAGSDVVQPLHRRVLSEGSNVIIRTVLGLPYRDTQCGFKLYRNEAAKRLFSSLTMPRFSYDLEVLSRARDFGLRVAEVGVRWRDKAGSTVRPRDVFDTLIDVVRLRLRSMSQVHGEALRFGAVGVVNTLVDAAVYFLLTRGGLFATALVTAKAFSFVAATLSSFFLNRRFTFRVEGPVRLAEVARFYASVSVGFVVNIFSMYVFVHVLGIYDLLALVLTTGLTFLINFMLTKAWVFDNERAYSINRQK